MRKQKTSFQYENLIKTRIEDSIKAAEMLKKHTVEIADAALLITEALSKGGKIILFGNGGSAADAQHIAGELTGRFRMERKALPAMALSVNSSLVTSLGNDYGFPEIFSRQIEAFGKIGDVAVGISTSGNSENVVAAVKKAREAGLKTITLTGASGGRLSSIADVPIRCPSNDTPCIQQMHILCGHAICEIVERELFD
jgi:D-sedoheptulose 7-phosphate isomerase